MEASDEPDKRLLDMIINATTVSLVDCAMNPLPSDIEQLVRIARQTGHDYADAFTVWRIYEDHPEAYLIVDTVLWIAKNQQVAVMSAVKLYRDIENQLG
jgi:hypothetical protein